MAKHELLNNIDHKDLRIRTERSAALGDNVMSCLTFAPEFRKLQAHFPIVFSRNSETGQYNAMALMGFQQGENLFLGPNGWEAAYVPAVMQMQPFMIGYQGQGADAQTVIHVDMESPRVSASEGVPVFLPQGGQSDYLKHIAATLEAVQVGHQSNTDFFAALEKHDLLEPFALDMELADGTKNRLAGFHTIKEESLYGLSGAALEELNKAGFLQPVFMAVASMSHLSDLIARKNERVARGAA